jgi:hypothetical protein
MKRRGRALRGCFCFQKSIYRFSRQIIKGPKHIPKRKSELNWFQCSDRANSNCDRHISLVNDPHFPFSASAFYRGGSCQHFMSDTSSAPRIAWHLTLRIGMRQVLGRERPQHRANRLLINPLTRNVKYYFICPVIGS